MTADHPPAQRGDARRPAAARRRHTGLLAVQDAVLVMASLFLVIGVAGFVPGITTGLDTMSIADHDSGARLFGVFGVSVLQNVSHLALGLAGLALCRTYARSRAYLLGGGVLFLGLWVYGLVVGSAQADFVPVSNADNWLHFGIGVTMVVLGLTLAGSRVPTGADGEVLLPPET